MICEYCKKDPGNKKPGVIWKGFRDADTDQLVCWKCQPRHYLEKFKNAELAGLYSEMPVINVPDAIDTSLVRKDFLT